MFTGIIQHIGAVAEIERDGDWKLTIEAPALMKDLAEGASVACNGICLTVIAREENRFKVQISSETMSKTTSAWWNEGTRLNLERALRMGDELGGHIVTGHIDGIARVIERHAEDESERYLFEVPAAFARFIAPKGSIALDGISLTVNEVQGTRFGVNIIPYTQQKTNIADRKLGDALNFEIDPLARYVARLVEAEKAGL
jgi:riboflavin synthase